MSSLNLTLINCFILRTHPPSGHLHFPSGFLTGAVVCSGLVYKDDQFLGKGREGNEGGDTITKDKKRIK